ncbi:MULTISPECIES: hypothetical protein [unclassified Colwellia]|jgi:hypothetical protein|uniref:hypothetical protein n=1 Tax=unclassified Colwellia TaxID=196834 RepID=UPI0015F73412|nr:MULTISPECIES: hypothetical protein [unclassified Colwellia]MBA6256445.1 hypothetical protein [Colwellia sp. MB3u-28]MBA6260352.1 hypothetical protein [Colwellia sp. MB3u-41]
MNDNLLNESLLESMPYKLLKIVYINSAKHAYTELPVNENLALFGVNNVGKTATLAGIKLVLFPESNFNSCEEKFHFLGKDGPYSKEESYPFYFPSPKSFIIAEIQNMSGVYTMVLYKGKSWEYSRFFVPRSYDNIRHLFWAKDLYDNPMFTDLSLKSIGEQLRKMNAVQTNDEEEIANMLYGGHRGHADQNKFCAIPLKNGASKKSISAFKNLYQLAFDIGKTEGDKIPKAIATLIEMNRSRKQEALDMTVTDQVEKYYQLAQERDYLQNVANHQDLWLEIDKDYKALETEQSEIITTVYSLKTSLEHKNNSFEQKFKTASEDQSKAQKDEGKAKAAVKVVKEANQLEKGAIGEKKKQFKTLSDDHKKALKIINDEYLGLKSALEIAVEFTTIKKEKEVLLAKHTNRESLEKALEESVKKSNELNNQHKQLLTNKKALEHTLLYKLEPHSASILNALNPKFSEFPFEHDESAIDTINDFGDLFTISPNKELLFGQSKFDINDVKPYSSELQLKQLKKTIERVELLINGCRTEISKIQTSLKNTESFKENVKTLETEIATFERDILLLESFNKTKIDYEKTKFEIEAREKELDVENTYLDNLQDKWKLTFFQKGEAESALTTLNEEKGRYVQWNKSIQLLTKTLDINDGYDGHVDDLDINQECLDNINERYFNYSNKFEPFKNKIRQLMVNVKVEGVEPFLDYLSLADYSEVISKFDLLFLEYPQKQQWLLKNIQSHNLFIDSQMSELQDAKNLLITFIEELNSDLNQTTISNIEELKLEIRLEPLFEELLDIMSNFDKSDDQALLPETFYLKISTFARKFFNKKNRTIKLQSIISTVNYCYRLQGETKFETKGQSGGTTSAITALLLSTLLKRISPSYAEVTIPIVVDEIGTLDMHNIDATIKQISSKGFTVFCATPHFSPPVIKGCGNYITMDQFTIEKPVVKGCQLLVLPEYIERLKVN